jgi:uncharacterized metal-binding protein YceD (DUF177 family)
MKIYIDRLQNGEVEQIREVLPPAFLELAPHDELHVEQHIQVTGQAYVAEDFLIIKLDIQAKASLPCSLCNEPFSFPIQIECIHEELIEKIPHGVFHYAELIREAILLEIPFYPQCGGDVCKNRKKMDKYLSKDTSKQSKEQYHPFKDIL